MDALPFYVVLPVFNEDVVRKLDVPGRIHARPIDCCLVDVTEGSELATHPVEEIVRGSIFLLRARRNASVSYFHISFVPIYEYVHRITLVNSTLSVAGCAG